MDRNLAQDVPLEQELAYGSRGSAVAALHERLRQLGYLPQGDIQTVTPLCSFPPADDATYDLVTMGAVAALQRNRALPVTGALDADTIALLAQPTCGNPDTTATPLDQPLPMFVAFPTGAWKSPSVTYAVKNYNGLSEQYVHGVLEDAYGQWAKATDGALTVTRIAYVHNGSHNIEVDFDEFKSASTLANASPANGTPTSLTFNKDKYKDESNRPTFLSTALHEGGHTLGLGHTAMLFNVMLPSSLFGRTELGDGDKQGIKFLYSSPPAGIRITNATDRGVSWFCFNARDAVKWIALASGDLGRDEISFYDPPDNGTDTYFVRFTLFGGGTELAGGIVKKTSKITLEQKGSSLFVKVS